MPTQAELREMFWLHEDTGVIYWRKAPSRNVLPWQEAGAAHGERRRKQIKINRKQYMAHNVAWTYAFGPIPKGMFVDHRDRDEGNNTPTNLRLTTHSMNCQNRVYKNSSNTHVGVYSHGKGWTAKITINGKRKYLGFFDNETDAIAARAAAVKEAGQLHLVEKFKDKQ
jgi:hypothetical protein